MLQDVVHAWRTLRRAPAYAALVATTLALGIGANSAIFNVAWQVLLKPLPFADEGRLVMVWEAFGRAGNRNPVAPATFGDWRDQANSFEALAAFNLNRSTLNLTRTGEPRELEVAHVTEGFFALLGIRPIVGRTLLPADTTNEGGLIVLSSRLWRDAFSGDPSVVGRSVRLHDESFQVLGVVPDSASFGFGRADAWVRLPLRGDRARNRQAHYLLVIGKLKPGVTAASAEAEVRAVTERAHTEFRAPGVAESARVTALREELTGQLRPAVLVILAGAALVLLIACANVSGLQLARQVRRRRVHAIQAALGASRARQVRGWLSESLLISLPAAAAGLILGAWLLVVVTAAAPALTGLQLQTAPDAAVVLYTLLISSAAALICATASSITAGGPLDSLRGGRSTTGSRTAARFRMVLIALQVAVSVLVLIGGALLVTSLWRVLRVDPGFTIDEGLVVNIELPQVNYPDVAERARFFAQATARLNALPGVAGSCAMTAAPLTPRHNNLTWVAEGSTQMVNSLPASITSDCFDVLQIPLLRGRPFAEIEREPVMIVSRSLGRQLFGDQDPLGRRVHMGIPEGPMFTVVGVVGDIRSTQLETNYGNQAWLSSSQTEFPPTRQLVVGAKADAATLTDAVRSAIREIDPKLPVSRISTVAEVRAASLADRRFNMLLLVVYGLIGWLLCAVGVYGVLSETVSARVREIGIRMALGARPWQVVWSLVVGTTTSVLVGCALGVLAAAALSTFIRSMLFRISPTEPTVYAAVVLMVVAVSMVAAFIPARRAIRVDPLEALRVDG